MQAPASVPPPAASRPGSFELRPLEPRRDPDFWRAWSQLAHQASPFLRPEFFALERALLDEGEPLVAAAYTEGTLSAVLPLVRRGRTLLSLHTDHAPFYDLVGDPAALAGLWRTLDHDRGWDQLVLTGVPAGSRLALELPALALQDLDVSAPRPGARSPYLALPGHEARLSTKLKQNNRRCLRKLGGVELERLGGYSRPVLEEALALEAMAWKGAAGTSIQADPRTRHFYLALARLAARRDELALYFLRSGGRRIAFLYALEHAGHVYALKIGYDPAFADFSPGHLLLAEVARDAEARGLVELELLGHRDAWKTRWTEQSHDHVSLVVYRASPRGALRLIARELVKPRLSPRWMASAVQLRSELERYTRPCQHQDLVGVHTRRERIGGRLRHGLGVRSGLRRVLAGAAGTPALGAPSVFTPGQWVRVRDAAQVIASLDTGGMLRGLAFVPAQWSTCGQVYRVARSVRRLVDDRGLARAVARTVLLEGVTCDCGGESLGCGRSCPLLFRDEWLEEAEAPAEAASKAAPGPATWATVRSQAAILATLDGQRRRDGVTFLPEMARFAGQRLRVLRQLPRVFELARWTPTRAPVYLLEGAQCHGDSLGGEGPCDRACTLLWHGDWLTLETAAP